MKKEKSRWNALGYRRLTAMMCVLSIGLAGCGTVVEEEDNMVIVEHNKEESVYMIVLASVADVVKTESVRCTYKQVNDESVSFSVGGKKVTAVYVEKGDEVKKGQLLAELDGSDRQDEIEALEYSIARNQLQLGYLDINEEYDKSQRWWNYVYRSSGSQAEDEKRDADLASIEQSYRYQREDLMDAIELDTLELNRIKTDVAQSRIYAGMDGMVSSVKTELLNSVSIADDPVIKIIDSSVCLFECSAMKFMDNFEKGKVVEMSLGYGNNATVVEALPYDFDNWESKMSFEVLTTEETPEIAVGSSGIIKLELDRREQVISVPKNTIHTAEGKTYVYILGENDIREVRWVEIGLQGDELVEIVSGLTEGENVILK